LQNSAGTAWLGRFTNGVVDPMPADPGDQSGLTETPHYHGHRERCANAFMAPGPTP
jgi:hypothetical protein